nr:hypothetical protein [Tetrasphaera sp. HKS02]
MRRLEVLVEPIGRLRHGLADATGGAVPSDGQGRSLTAQPGLAQHVGQQRQRPRLAADLPHEQVGKPGFEAQAGLVGGTFDRGTQVWLTHSPQQVQAMFDQTRQPRVGGQCPHPVGPQGDHEVPVRPLLDERVHPARPLVGIDLLGEPLLALVHHQGPPGRSLHAGKGLQRSRARGDHEHPTTVAVQCGGDTSADHRRFATPGWAHHRQHLPGVEPVEAGRDIGLPAEEGGAVLDPERQQSGVGTHRAAFR